MEVTESVIKWPFIKMTEGQRQNVKVNYTVNLLLCGKKNEKLTCDD